MLSLCDSALGEVTPWEVLWRSLCGKNLNPPAASQVSELGSRPIYRDCGPTLQLDCSLMRDPEPEAKPFLDPRPSESV